MGGVYSKAHEGEGLARVYENSAWMVGIKNYKAANDSRSFSEIERHNETDELFLLLSGSCVLLSARETGGSLVFEAETMLPGKLYAIPAKLWHTTITEPGSKLALIEDPRTGGANSDVLVLKPSELAAARSAIAAERSAPDAVASVPLGH
ncbi:MAG: hypothetical protein Q8M76_16730 [Spirochaetaceae bacterium]|nr:hypothetical protein [Spirochaetaceae bacterium]